MAQSAPGNITTRGASVTSGPRPLAAADDRTAHPAHRLGAILNRCSDGVSVHTAAGRLVFANYALCAIVGRTADELVRVDFAELVHPNDLQRAVTMFRAAFVARGDTEPIRYRLRQLDGELRTVESVVSDLLDAPEVDGIVVTTRDITDQLAAELRLKKLALTDVVTGLANRTALETELVRLFEASSNVALVYIEVDGLDWMIDASGYAATDEALRALGQRIRTRARNGVVAHLGNGAFAVPVVTSATANHLLGLADAIAHALAKPLHVGGQVIHATASIGIATAHEPEICAAQLLKAAATTAHCARERGGARVQLFDARLAARMERRLAIAHDLHHALTASEFEVHYQPIVNLETRQTCGAEALLRWTRNGTEQYAPDEFIEMAERTGLIVPLGEFALRRALAARARIDKGVDLAVNVNLSVRQLAEPALLDTIKAAIEESSIAPDQVAFEITETLALQDFPRASRVINDIRALGCRVGIDDFGTGFSSLSYLHRLSIDFIKIDRTFVEPLGTNANTDSLVSAILAIGHALKVRIVAEGIETEDQLARLRNLGCRYGQGFLFSRPMPTLAAAAERTTIREVLPNQVVPAYDAP